MLLPLGTRSVWLGHLRGPPGVTGGEWLWKRGVLGEGVWRRPGTQSVFELQQLSREQAANELEISRKAEIGLGGPVDSVFTGAVVFICRQVEALGQEAGTP